MRDHYPESLYYQVGGFRPNICLQGEYKYNLNKLAGALFASKPSLELVLGIRPSGASSLLVPVSEWVRSIAFQNPGSPHHAADFLSLSPLWFDDIAELAKKLNALKPKGRRAGEDDSAANKAFLGNSDDSGRFRSAFEQNRLLFHAFQPASDVRRFGLSRSAPWAAARIISLAYNEWMHEKGALLDIGWSLLDQRTHPPTFNESVHLELDERRNLGNKGKRRVPFGHGTAEVLSQDGIARKLRDLLRPERRPTVLLVDGEAPTRALLESLGVDTDGWAFGLADLLRNPEPPRRSQYSGRDPRRRSRSPRRDERRHDERRRSPPRAPPAVFVVDVRQLYTTLRQITGSRDALTRVAVALGLEADVDGMCAGNESRLLAEMWTAMASGPAIDEQYSARWGADAVPSASKTPGAGTASGSRASAVLDPGDPDFDPNDLAPVGVSGLAQPSRAEQYDSWDELDDDEEEHYAR
ncbi:hypothetical protein BC834DRAFT_853839 [Gloeopeniophorella convolvens]|nr:hypothetical protein BC834DRAFT_853839 [Gloeopeniophorella convolvens]